jgi:hypothetical protein
MTVLDVEPRRNGTSGAAMPTKTHTVKLDEIGYPGWFVSMRTNPRSSVYDDLISGEEQRWWKAFGQIVVEWNFADENGRAMPQPKEVEVEKDLDLPIGILAYVLDRYFDAVKGAAAIPKAPSDSSAVSSSTSGASQESV